MKNISKRHQQIFWMTFLIVGGIYIFREISEIETHGGSLRINALVVFVYDRLGKWGVLGMFFLIAPTVFIDIPDYSNPKYIRRNNPKISQNLRLPITLDFREVILGCNKKIAVQHSELIGNRKFATVTRELTLTIPSGVHSGVIFMLMGEGHKSPSGDSGNLFVIFENLPSADDRFRREGANIISDLQITKLQAQQGDRVSIQTISGIHDIVVPPGTKNNDRLVVKEKGLPAFHPRECFIVSAGTCRDSRKNIVKKMGFNIFVQQPARGHHIACVNISESIETFNAVNR